LFTCYNQKSLILIREATANCISANNDSHLKHIINIKEGMQSQKFKDHMISQLHVQLITNLSTVQQVDMVHPHHTFHSSVNIFGYHHILHYQSDMTAHSMAHQLAHVPHTVILWGSQ